MYIPASDVVVVNPGVVGSGGNPLALNGLILTKNSLLPTKSVQSFAGAAAVSAFFGPASPEYALSQIYSLGYDNSTIKPGALLFAPYVDVARAAWLQSDSLAAVSLTQLKAIAPGTLTLTVNGSVKTSATINLSGATSFSNAAALIQAGFTAPNNPTCVWNAVNSTFTLTSPTTGDTSTITFASGSLADALMFTAAAGALLSQGQAVDTPASAMNAIKAASQNWVDFMTLWEPTITEKGQFADWSNAQNQRFMYVVWDTDPQAIVQNSAACFGAVAKTAAYDGVMCVYNSKELAAFVLSCVGSIDFTRANGRITAAFKSQSGFTPTVTDQQIAANLLANGYSFYGAYATANRQFNFLFDGNLPGKWKWLDTFINQVYLNSQFQLALLSLLNSVGSIPYNEDGYSLVRAAMTDPIDSALSFGSIRQGVTLSAPEKAQINQAAGRDVSPILEQRGYYLQVLDPGQQVRVIRGTPVINFWYTDGGAVQKINVASIDVL